MVSVGVVGTTSWGTTLGIILAQRGIEVALWARTPKEAATLQRDGEHRRLLPGFPFPDHLGNPMPIISHKFRGYLCLTLEWPWLGMVT